ncbi:hypothetical protein [Ornithinimicrobium panacihumi]|uniref:hypothetical protein n=1 Tax=Ornithinimicrobium panacihumi TaxID=2008449 RepID=UPI003F894003
MTLRNLHEGTPLPPPRRTGQPWTDDDYQTLLRLVRDGVEIEEIAEQLARSTTSVRMRAVRMLPVDQRGVPQDRAVEQLRKNLLADEDYEWEGHLASSPPPRPVVQCTHPPATLSGVPGLRDDELLVITRALATSPGLRTDRDPLRDEGVREECARQVVRRGLASELVTDVGHHASNQAEAFLALADYPDIWEGPPW